MKANLARRSTHRKQPLRQHTLLLDKSTLKNESLLTETSLSIPTLTFLSGDALGKELPLLQPQVTLGRGEDADVTIMDPSVSRKHVRLTCRKLIHKGENQELKVVLRDLDSMNGTLVNYRRVRRAVLRAGDKIYLGRVILKFEYRDLADKNFFDEIYRLATMDGLTALLNRAAIMRELRDEMVKRRRYRRKLAVVLMDLDDFKSLNDTYGHLIGDRALQAVAQVLRRNLRQQDRAGRYGGEEFLLVLPETGLKGAAALAERIRDDLERSVRRELALERPVTASFGVSFYPLDADDSENLIDHADAALYRAKGRGKNRVELWKQGRGRSAPGIEG
jgi:two-component system, cell cycle response regulator